MKYAIDYPRLRDAIDHCARWTIERTVATDRIFDLYDEDATDIPVGLHNHLQVAEFQLEEARSELNGAIWFTALLSRVDGLVLMDPDLAVKGFGVVIRSPIRRAKFSERTPSRRRTGVWNSSIRRSMGRATVR